MFFARFQRRRPEKLAAFCWRAAIALFSDPQGIGDVTLSGIVAVGRLINLQSAISDLNFYSPKLAIGRTL